MNWTREVQALIARADALTTEIMAMRSMCRVLAVMAARQAPSAAVLLGDLLDAVSYDLQSFNLGRPPSGPNWRGLQRWIAWVQ
jgi:hypothetical protein